MPFVIILDNGNWKVKAISGQTKISFLHQIAPIMSHEYKEGMERYGAAARPDFLHIDDEYYVVGETAQYYNVIRRQGAPRYTRGYYGVLFASAVARAAASLGAKNAKGIYTDLKRDGLVVMASHASRDYAFRVNLEKALLGAWDFMANNERFSFKVHSVECYEEPFGGYANRAFVKTERGNWQTPYAGETVGIIDGGGGNCGTLIIAAGGEVQYTAAASADQGMNNAVERLRNALKSQYPDFFGVGRDIPTNRLQRAIQTGWYHGKGSKVNVQDLVDAAVNPLLNEIYTMWTQQLGGGLGLDRVILTGGANILIGEKVKAMLDFPSEAIEYATGDTTDMLEYANVSGAQRYRDLIEAMSHA
jgi:hypothetical protein